MKQALILTLLVALGACKGYEVTVQPPDCTVSNSQQECQAHTTSPVNDSQDSNPEFKMN